MRENRLPIRTTAKQTVHQHHQGCSRSRLGKVQLVREHGVAMSVV
ncbi:Uncharacterised protein [Vibrio cholerae]|nr:Uncharacterised protein [Vibrio cholerae]